MDPKEPCADARLKEFVEMIARMETADEYDERTNGEGMSGDDAVDTVSDLVRRARELLFSGSTKR